MDHGCSSLGEAALGPTRTGAAAVVAVAGPAAPEVPGTDDVAAADTEELAPAVHLKQSVAGGSILRPSRSPLAGLADRHMAVLLAAASAWPTRWTTWSACGLLGTDRVAGLRKSWSGIGRGAERRQICLRKLRRVGKCCGSARHAEPGAEEASYPAVAGRPCPLLERQTRLVNLSALFL